MVYIKVYMFTQTMKYLLNNDVMWPDIITGMSLFWGFFQHFVKPTERTGPGDLRISTLIPMYMYYYNFAIVSLNMTIETIQT